MGTHPSPDFLVGQSPLFCRAGLPYVSGNGGRPGGVARNAGHRPASDEQPYFEACASARRYLGPKHGLRVYGATITDNYWVKTDEEQDLCWAKVRFSQNYFADVALHGSFDSFSKQYTPEQLRTPTPELTNIGSYEKCWRLIDGEVGHAQARLSSADERSFGFSLRFLRRRIMVVSMACNVVNRS